jgi:hypothetical protein
MLKQRWSLGASASSDPQGFEILIQRFGGGGRSDRLTFLAGSLPVWEESTYRFLRFASTASAAESFRSRCASLRGTPLCSSQTSFVAAPQVGQGTESVCFMVSSLLFTATE